jgi:hypothetical protein
MTTIDCDHYKILARRGHPCERTLVKRDDAVGLAAARRIARRMRDAHADATVEVFLCDRGAVTLVADV